MNTATQAIPAGALEQSAELRSILRLLMNSSAYPDDYYTPAVARCVTLAQAITEEMDDVRTEASTRAAATGQHLFALVRTLLRDHFDVMANDNWDAQWDRLSWLYSLGAHLAEECERHLANPEGAA